MTPEELGPVWAAFWEGDPEAHEILVEQYLPLANYLARRALAKAPAHQDIEDIHSYAHHGLLDAISKFKPDGGAKFETYATKRISGAILDGQRSQDPLTRSGRRSVKTMATSVDALWTSLGREPTLQEIAEHSGLTVADVRRSTVDQQSMTASVEYMSEQASDSQLRITGGDVELNAQMVEVRALIARRLSFMPGRERAFTLLYYCDERSRTQTAEALGIGFDWCNRIRGDVLKAIRS